MSDAPSSNAQAAASPLRLVAVVIGLIIIALLAYQISMSSVAGNSAGNQITMRTIGLTSPVLNRLDPAFKDTDNDLVADAPADPDRVIDPDTLTFSFIAQKQGGEQQLATFADFTDYLAEQVGRPVEAVAYESTDEQLKALRSGKLHLTLLNTGSVPIAVNAAGFVPVAAPGKQTPQAYRMVIITPNDSDIQTVTDLRGRELTLTRPTSNSGFKAPIVMMLHDFGMKPNLDFMIRNSWGHENSIREVVEGKAEAAAVASDLLDRMIASGEISSADVQIIYRSEPFPAAVLGYSALLKPELRDQLDQAISDFSFEDTSLTQEYSPNRADRFAPVSFKDDFALVRRIDDAIGFEHKLDIPEASEQDPAEDD